MNKPAVKANRVGFVDHREKEVWAEEVSCPWVENCGTKFQEKTAKYGSLRWKLKRQYPSYDIEQCNSVIDVLGGWSNKLESFMKKLVGAREKDVLRRMQKAIISCSLNIARTFKATLV